MNGMLALALQVIAAATLGAAPPNPTAASNPPLGSELMEAFRTSDVAEIYILRRDLEFVVAPRPDTVRALGCGYRVRRNSRAWDELQQVLEQAAIEIRPATYVGEVRLGLVLGDERGTIFEIYANHLQSTPVGMNGFSQRQVVEISASFDSTLRDFGERHPELALPDLGPMRRCPHEARR